jgi:hypothetical protein
MAMTPFLVALAGFRQWADTTDRKLAGDAAADAGELLTLLQLMEDELGLDRPADLGEGDLEELLLGIYPRSITVLSRADLEDTIPAIRDFLTYLAERGEMPEATARALERELDWVAPRFADAVMDQPDWDPLYEDHSDLDLKEAFSLPDQMPPMRLPQAAELAAAARRAPIMGELMALAEWAGRKAGGRAVNENAELAGAEAAEAAAELGIEVPYLDYLRWLALDTGFLELDEDETHVIAGPGVQAWRDSNDDETLDTWETVFAFVLCALDVAASLDPRRSRELDFSGHGAGLAVTLFLTRAEGLSVAEASEVIKATSVSELAPDRGVKAWESWVRAHGDPARLLLDRMTRLGAARVYDDGERARLTPLGLAAMRDQLARHGVEIPLLPPADQMTAADLLAMADGVSEEDFDAECAAWLGHRPPESAARELLSIAGQADPSSRMLAVAVVTEIGAPAEPAWRDALGRIEVSGYAKVALAALAGDDPGASMRPEFELTEDELGWTLTDALVTEGWADTDEDAEHDPAALAGRLGEAFPPGTEGAGFELIARVPHPDAPDVLTTIGRHYPDKKMAKLARKAAYKAASRHAARQRDSAR